MISTRRRKGSAHDQSILSRMRYRCRSRRSQLSRLLDALLLPGIRPSRSSARWRTSMSASRSRGDGLRPAIPVHSEVAAADAERRSRRSLRTQEPSRRCGDATFGDAGAHLPRRAAVGDQRHSGCIVAALSATVGSIFRRQLPAMGGMAQPYFWAGIRAHPLFSLQLGWCRRPATCRSPRPDPQPT